MNNDPEDVKEALTLLISKAPAFFLLQKCTTPHCHGMCPEYFLSIHLCFKNSYFNAQKQCSNDTPGMLKFWLFRRSLPENS